MNRRTPLRADAAKTRDWLDRSRKPLATHAPLERSGPLPKVNRKRKEKLWRKQFHSEAFVSWVHSLGCSVPSCQDTEIQAAHAISRGSARGTWEDILPLCARHHDLSHTMGPKTFERHVGFRLADVAASVQMRWRAFAGEVEI